MLCVTIHILILKSGEIGHSAPWGEDTVVRGVVIVAFKPAVNSVLTPQSVVSNLITFDRQSSIYSLSPHPVLSIPPVSHPCPTRVPPVSQVSEYPAWSSQCSMCNFQRSSNWYWLLHICFILFILCTTVH